MGPLHLLNTTTLTFERPLELSPQDQAATDGFERAYAILSHRWMPNSNDEVTFEDIMTGRARQKAGLSKIEGAARQARKDKYNWIWIDTCCIDKRSSAELSESINSMYKWYGEAGCCYAYLQDVEPASHETFHESDWFKRGWTLQELIAPVAVKFFDAKWSHIGDRIDLAGAISRHSGIHADVLKDSSVIERYSVVEKMAWAASRTTTRKEDIAYCLLGIFNVNLVPLYGEGPKAFMRLQEEIIRHSDDHTIFAWSMASLGTTLTGLLAPDPVCFQGCSGMMHNFATQLGRPPFSTTNRGLSINLPITPWTVDTYLAWLECWGNEPHHSSILTAKRMGVFLRRLDHDDQYARINLHGDHAIFLDEKRLYADCLDVDKPRRFEMRQLFVPSSPRPFPGSDIEALGRGGCRILMKDLEESSNDIAFPLDSPCQLTIVECGESSRFRQIAVGFNFDLDPVCLLVDQEATRQLIAPVTADDEDKVIKGRTYKMVVGQRYNEVVKGRRIYRRMDEPDLHELHDGIWRLHCHRRTAREVQLQHELGGQVPQVRFRRSKDDRLIWEVEIKDVDLPSANGTEQDPLRQPPASWLFSSAQGLHLGDV